MNKVIVAGLFALGCSGGVDGYGAPAPAPTQTEQPPPADPPPATKALAASYPIELPAVAAGIDDNFCITVPLDPALLIGGSEFVFEAKGVHHANTWASNAAPSPMARCSSLPAAYTIVGVWAPGTEALDLGEYALRLPAGASSISIAVHVLGPVAAGSVGEFRIYSAASGAPLAQYTQMRATVPIIPPATAASSEHGCTLTKDATVMAAWPHMHGAGVGFTATAGAGMVVDVEWNVNKQLLYRTNVAARAGEKLSIRCEWLNDTASPIKLGPMVGDEMCVFGAIVAPAGAMPEQCFAAGS